MHLSIATYCQMIGTFRQSYSLKIPYSVRRLLTIKTLNTKRESVMEQQIFIPHDDKEKANCKALERYLNNMFFVGF